MQFTDTTGECVPRGRCWTQSPSVKRALAQFDQLRDEYALRVAEAKTVLLHEENEQARWWTWPGVRANAVLVAGLLEVALELLDETRRFNNWQIGLRKDTAAGELREALNEM